VSVRITWVSGRRSAPVRAASSGTVRLFREQIGDLALYGDS
jgi:hypothetical protein